MRKTKARLEPIHPGEILLEDFMKPNGVSINRLARELFVPPGRISNIVNGKRAITADTALRLGLYFGVSPEIWTGLQSEYELRLARKAASDDLGRIIERGRRSSGLSADEAQRMAVTKTRAERDGRA